MFWDLGLPESFARLLHRGMELLSPFSKARGYPNGVGPVVAIVMSKTWLERKSTPWGQNNDDVEIAAHQGQLMHEKDQVAALTQHFTQFAALNPVYTFLG